MWFSNIGSPSPRSRHLSGGLRGLSSLRFESLEQRQLLAANVLFRINAGGGTLAGDPSWTSDTGFSNVVVAESFNYSVKDSIKTNHYSLPKDVPAALFQTEQWDSAAGAEMQWDFKVTPGSYEVRLYFAEIYSGAQGVGKRVFDVAIEGNTVLDNYDIYADVGGYTGVMKSFVVTSDGNLDIDFAHVVQNPAVKGIEVLQLDASRGLVASQSSLRFEGVLVGHHASRTLTLTNQNAAGGDAITIDPAVFTLTGAEADRFAATMESSTAVTVGPGESVDLMVTFDAVEATSDAASLLIPHTGDHFPLVIELQGSGVTDVPISFGKSVLAGENAERPTSLQFGPDGRLYVAQQNGLLRIYSIERQGPNDYRVTASETLTAIQQIPNHNDDGTLNPTINERLVTGLLVTGTAARPVLYVTSSDPRIGAGGSGEDLNLDTNSGILSRLTWNGAAWEQLDLVRGLPRSEENHAPNGMALDPLTNTLYIAQGGLTNMGAPSNNFAYLPEFALSAAILSVDLAAIGETTYDLPTLDDEDRPGSDDANDPFGGNDGLNQAKLVPGGPVQVYAPGFRNPYDVIITEQGRMYAVDNGPNSGWGGIPAGEGPAGNATNAPRDGGSTYGDGLHYITGEGYYAGHPNPTRSNPDNTFNNSNPQSPVAEANPIESDYRKPGTENGALHVWGSSTNGLAEYTASNFYGSLRGNLLAASFDGSIKRVELNAAGDMAVEEDSLFSSVSGVPLDVTTLGDDGPFPGTIWVATIGSGEIVVFEPADYGDAPPVVVNENDQDNDGYADDDELANGTSPTNAADVPADHDGDFLSNLLDDDDDNDGLLDTVDPFAIDPHNGLTTPVGTSYGYENEGAAVGGLLNTGFTGLMTNRSDDYESLFDPTKLTAGGAAGVFTIDEIGEGDAAGALNTQTQAFQFGVNLATATTPVTAHTRVLAPFASEIPQGEQSFGLFIGNGDQDNYVKVVIDATGVTVQPEINGVVGTAVSDPLTLPGPLAIDLYLTVDVALSRVQASYRVEEGERVELGPSIAVPSSWLNSAVQGMAVGIISTSHGEAPPIAVTWDLVEVTTESTVNLPPVLESVPPQVLTTGTSKTISIKASDPDGDPVTLSVSGLPSYAHFVDHGDGSGTLTLSPGAMDVGIDNLVVTAHDAHHPELATTQLIPVTVKPAVLAGKVVYRVNAGGPAVSGTPGWTTDVGFTNSSAAQSNSYTSGSSVSLAHSSIPVGTPSALFSTERWDSSQGAPMQWNFDVLPGRYEVRLYFAEAYDPVKKVGGRVFDVDIEGERVLDKYDIFADVGANKGVMKSFVVQSDANLDIDFAHVTQNPLVRAIEILTVGSQPNTLGSSESAIAFGVISTEETALRSITLTNLGGADDPVIRINTADILFSGPGAAAYSLFTAGVLMLAPGQAAELEVQFAPQEVGEAPASMVVPFSGDASPLAIELTGTGALPAAASSRVTVEVDSGGSLSSSSTYSSGSFKITNHSSSDHAISQVYFDIESALLPDVVFDPYGKAGDPVGKDLTPNSGASATGFEEHWFDKFQDDGFQALGLAFADFDPGETFSFSVDIDPTSIRGAEDPGPSAAGSVSGLELSGSTVRIVFEDGSAITSELFRKPGSDTGGIAVAESPIPSPPTLQLVGLAENPTTTPNAEQTLRISGPAGGTVRLLHAEGALHLSGVPGGGYDVDPFESNKVIGLAEQTITLGASGTIDLPVTLLKTHDEGGLNHFLAVVTDANGDTGPVARTLVEYDPELTDNRPPLLSFISDLSVVAGDTQTIGISATDPDGDRLTLQTIGLPGYATFIDLGNGSGTLTVAPGEEVTGEIDFTIRATDNGEPSLSDSQQVTLSVTPEVIVDPASLDGQIVYRINAGGGSLAGDPSWSSDAGFSNAAAAQSFSYVSHNSVSTGHASLPAGTPSALFQSERYDNLAGAEMQWDFDVEPGAYEVRLYFAETYSGALGVGKRVFDVAIEGETVLDNYDIYADVGGFTGVMKSFLVESDGNLDIDFGHVVQNPAVKGIEIVQTSLSRLFFQASTSLTVSELDAAGIYPRGEEIAFGFYSVIGQNDFDPTKTNIERVAEAGFTLVGPYYHRNWEDFTYIYEAAAEGLKYSYQVRRHPSLEGISVNDRPAAIAKLSNEQIAAHVRLQVEAILNDPIANGAVARWSVEPEEIRYWKPDELRYLEVAVETIRQVEREHGFDPRPIWSYEPNHRDAAALERLGGDLDLITKGVYLTTRHDRGPQRAGFAVWSFEQLTAAAKALGKTPQAVFQLSEDFTDPRTGIDPVEIRRVLRHDVYLGLVMGIQSLNVWSHYEGRAGLTTHNEQFEAYGSVAQDLTGELDLERVFLLGEKKNDLELTVTSGPDSFEYEHSDGQDYDYDTLHYFNAVVDGERYLILVNSSESPLQVRIDGLPEAYLVDDLFAGSSALRNSRSMTVSLDTLGVTAYRFRATNQP